MRARPVVAGFRLATKAVAISFDNFIVVEGSEIGCGRDGDELTCHHAPSPFGTKTSQKTNTVSAMIQIVTEVRAFAMVRRPRRGRPEGVLLPSHGCARPPRSRYQADLRYGHARLAAPNTRWGWLPGASFRKPLRGSRPRREPARQGRRARRRCLRPCP